MTFDRGSAEVRNELVPKLLTIVDAARLLGIGRTTLYELIARGQLEVLHIGRAARIPIESVDSFIDALRRGCRDPEWRTKPLRLSEARTDVGPRTGATSTATEAMPRARKERA
jgi:excisionase family DNA binding protein